MSNFPTNNKFYVYCFKNDVNNKVYIGKTNDLKSRFNKHKSANGDCPIFHNAIKKYGIEKFQFQIIKECETEEAAISAEIYFIEYYKSNVSKYGSQYGYNLTEGGDGLSGHKHSEESKLKISNSKKGQVSPNKGKLASEETKIKLSISHLGHPSYWAGKKLSEETKIKKSETMKGKTWKMIDGKRVWFIKEITNE